MNDAIRKDGNEWFGIMFGLMFFKGILASLAGPAPNYDMQRVLATRNPREACLMNGMVNVVLYFPRYMMITGITVLALAFCMPELRAMDKPDFEKLLPMVLTRRRADGRRRLAAGRAAGGVHVQLRRHDQRRAGLHRQRHLQTIHQSEHAAAKRDVALSRVASLGVLVVGIVFGLLTDNITDVMMWIVGALYGGYVMANVLKWYWWRFNGYGYFWGMMAGILGAMSSAAAFADKSDKTICSCRNSADVVHVNPLYFIPVSARPFARRLLARHVSQRRQRTRRSSSISTKRRAPGAFGARFATRSCAKIRRSSPIAISAMTRSTSPSASSGNCA